jgi:translation elongation factor EF-G
MEKAFSLNNKHYLRILFINKMDRKIPNIRFDGQRQMGSYI